MRAAKAAALEDAPPTQPEEGQADLSPGLLAEEGSCPRREEAPNRLLCADQSAERGSGPLNRTEQELAGLLRDDDGSAPRVQAKRFPIEVDGVPQRASAAVDPDLDLRGCARA